MIKPEDNSLLSLLKKGLSTFPPLSAEIWRRFQQALPRLLAVTEERLNLEIRTTSKESTRKQQALLKELYGKFGRVLLAVYAFHLYPNLAEEIHWILSVMKSRGLDKSSAEKLIETWTIAIHGLIKPSDADELARPLSWARARIPELWNVLSSSEDECPADVKKFLELALRGRRRDAADHVLSLSKRGCPPEKICDDVFFPALKQIGLLWQHNKVSAADEHAATDIIRYVMFRLFDGSLREPRLSFKAVLSCVPGDEHEIGAEMMAGFLDLKGWSVLFLGRSSPAEDILRTVSGRHSEAIFLVLSLIEYLPEAHGLILSIRKNAPHAKIILAGAAAAGAKNILDQISDGIVIGLEEGYSTATALVSTDA